MRPSARERPEVDAVVLGSGAAGLRVAIEAAPLTVALLTKTPHARGGASTMARGGIAAAVGPGDSPSRHEADSLASGAGLADLTAVHELTAAGPSTIERLIGLGVRFDREAGGGLALAREAAHSSARVTHAADATGEELVRALLESVAQAPHVTVRTRRFAESLLVEKGRVVGVIARAPDGSREIHRARAVVLATGGIGHIYSATTNPPEATGDGLAMAARAGATLADLEFVQFHPTALDAAIDPRPLLTEALRGAGARFTDARGIPLSLPDGRPAELASRDVVSAWLAFRAASGLRTYLDARPVGAGNLRARFPAACAVCASAGFDPATEPLPIAPAAHYHMGGVAIDRNGRTSIPGLWACGEVACSGAHGANRLASNSLLEALVLGELVAADVRRSIGVSPEARRRPNREPDEGPSDGAPFWAPPPNQGDTLRAAVTEGLGVLRDGSGIARLLRALPDVVPAGASGEIANMVLVASLVARGALLREESRGAHRRSDFPRAESAFAYRRLASAAELVEATEPMATISR